MTYDLVVKDARIVDGTGKPAYAGDVAITDGRIAAVGEVTGEADAHDRRRRPGRRARVHRRAHALRRAAALGPDRESVDRARDHDDPHRQLRVHARARPVRRPGLPDGAVRGRRGDPEAGAAALRPVRLGDVPGVPRLAATAASASTSLTQVGHSAVRRFVMGEAALERAATDDEIAQMVAIVRGGDGRGRGGHQQQPGAAPARRARRAHPVVLRRPGRDPRAGRGGAAQGQAPAVDQSGHEARRLERRGPCAARRARRGLGRRRVVERLRHGNARTATACSSSWRRSSSAGARSTPSRAASDPRRASR